MGLELLHKNYRPVSNLTFISKLVEHCVLHQFEAHCQEFNLMPDFQNYSCETSLLKMSNDILWGMENQSLTAVAILDSSATFDTVDHDLLLSILSQQFGIADTALKWYDSYLRPRYMKVCVNDVYSSEKQLTVSMLQEVLVEPTFLPHITA